MDQNHKIYEYNVCPSGYFFMVFDVLEFRVIMLRVWSLFEYVEVLFLHLIYDQYETTINCRWWVSVQHFFVISKTSPSKLTLEESNPSRWEKHTPKSQANNMKLPKWVANRN